MIVVKVLLAIVFLVSSALAQGQAWSWQMYQSVRYCPVEQQPMGNPTGSAGIDCPTDPAVSNPTAWATPGGPWGIDIPLWDADDDTMFGGSGTIAPGVEVERHFKVLADTARHIIGIRLGVDDADPSIQMEISLVRNGSHMGPSPFRQTVITQTLHRMCVTSPDYIFGTQFPQHFDVIAGSGLNGMQDGVAALVDVYVRIKNLGTKTLRKTNASAYVGWDTSSKITLYCPHESCTQEYTDNLVEHINIKYDMEP